MEQNIRDFTTKLKTIIIWVLLKYIQANWGHFLSLWDGIILRKNMFVASVDQSWHAYNFAWLFCIWYRAKYPEVQNISWPGISEMISAVKVNT